MNIKTQMGWASFLMALSAFNLPVDAAIAPPTSVTPTAQTQSSIEGRLTRISATLKANESQLPENTQTPDDNELARAWANGNGRAWANGGGWRNGNNWRNGGFHNNNWRNGGGFLNRH